jgi:hypothetical protein
MSLQSTYVRFLAAPSAGPLADDATLNYIPTLVSIHQVPAILKHFKGITHAVELKKREETPISSVEDVETGSLVIEMNTTLEFLAGGGAYLPKLDDNFLADRVVSIPIVSDLLSSTISSLSLYQLCEPC